MKKNFRHMKDSAEARDMYASYAIIRDDLVPIIPRYMSHRNLVDLRMMEPSLLVLGGLEFNSLCKACDKKMECIMTKYKEGCTVTHKMLEVGDGKARSLNTIG